MAKKITKSEIAEDDIFGAIKRSAETTIDILNQLSQALNNTATAVKSSIGGAKFDSTKAIDNFVKSTEKANKLSKEAQKVEQERAKAIAQRNKAMQEQQKRMQQVQKTEQETQKAKQQALRTAEMERKASERNAKAKRDETSAYQRLVVKTREQKRASQELAAKMLELEKKGKKGTREWHKLARAYQEVTNKARQGDKALKKIDKTVGDNFRNVGNYKSALQGLGRTMLMLGGGLSLVSALRDVAGIVVKFDQAQGDLLAISGKTKDELADLTEQAKKLGATTQFTATQITEMQIELAKLGFTTEEIQGSTKAVSNFAAATGADIPEAAALAGAAMRGFGLEADEMERVVSTMGVATTKSALDFSKLNTSMSTISPVARAFGFSIEDTTALLGVLSNAGFDASTAATSTRKILLNLADSGGDLAKELGRPIRNVEDLAGALKELDEKGIDLAQALELTDVRSVAAFKTFMEGTDDLIELKKGITDVNDELATMAAKRLDTIAGQWTLLGSAFEGFVLSVNESSGVGENVKNVIGFLARNLDLILSTLGKLISAFIKYKATLLAVKAIQWVINGGFQTMYKNILMNIRSLDLLGKEATKTGTKMTLMGRAMNAVPIIAMIGLIIELANAFIEMGNAAAYARKQQEISDKSNEQSQKFQQEVIDKEREAFEEKLRLMDLELREKVSNGEKQEKVDEERVKREKELADESVANINKIIAAEQDKLTEVLHLNDALIGNYSYAYEAINKMNKDQMKSYQKMKKEAEDAGVTFLSGDTQDAALKNLETLQVYSATQQATYQKNIGLLTQERKEFLKYVEDRVVARQELNFQLEKERLEQSKIKGQLREHNTELRNQIDLAEKLVELANKRLKVEEDLRKTLVERSLATQQDEIEKEYQAQVSMIEETGLMETDALDELIRVKGEMRKDARKKETDFEISSLNNEFSQKYAILRKNLDNEYLASLQAQEKTLQSNLKTAKDDAGAQAEAKRLYSESLVEVEKNYQNAIADLKKSELVEASIISQEIVLLKEEEKNDLLNIQREINEETVSKNDELISLQQSYWQRFNNMVKSKGQSVVDEYKQMWSRITEIAQFSTDLLIMLSDKRIQQLDKEIAAAEKQADTLRQLAINGNIDAQDSLAEQQRIIDEANRKKQIAERRKQQLEFANTAFQTYGSKVEAGSKNPLAETLRDLTLLQQAVAAFVPTFLEGTEDTGTHGQGVDGKGGFHAILHPNERVMTKEQNKKIGSISNEQLANIAQNYQNSKTIGSGAEQLGGPWQSGEVVKQLKSLENTIKNKPEHELAVEQVVQGAMNIVRTTKKGREVIYNRYKVK